MDTAISSIQDCGYYMLRLNNRLIGTYLLSLSVKYSNILKRETTEVIPIKAIAKIFVY